MLQAQFALTLTLIVRLQQIHSPQQIHTVRADNMRPQRRNNRVAPRAACLAIRVGIRDGTLVQQHELLLVTGPGAEKPTA